VKDEHGISSLADAVDEAMERIIARIEEVPPKAPTSDDRDRPTDDTTEKTDP
jgi:hypothetical protein